MSLVMAYSSFKAAGCLGNGEGNLRWGNLQGEFHYPKWQDNDD